FAAAVREIGILPVETGVDTLLTPGELLITGSSYDGRRSPDGAPGPGLNAQGYLDDIGMEARDVGCADLRGRVLRLTPSGNRPMTSRELADVASTLRDRGRAARASHRLPGDRQRRHRHRGEGRLRDDPCGQGGPGADHQPVPRLPDARRPAAHRDPGGA